MGIFEGIDPAKLGGGIGGLFVFLTIAYKAWQTLKQDSKGDKVDERVTAFTAQLQAQLDKAILRADTIQGQCNALQAENTKLAAQCASAQARAEFLAAENQQLRADLSGLRERLAKGPS